MLLLAHISTHDHQHALLYVEWSATTCKQNVSEHVSLICHKRHQKKGQKGSNTCRLTCPRRNVSTQTASWLVQKQNGCSAKKDPTTILGHAQISRGIMNDEPSDFHELIFFGATIYVATCTWFDRSWQARVCGHVRAKLVTCFYLPYKLVPDALLGMKRNMHMSNTCWQRWTTHCPKNFDRLQIDSNRPSSTLRDIFLTCFLYRNINWPTYQKFIPLHFLPRIMCPNYFLTLFVWTAIDRQRHTCNVYCNCSICCGNMWQGLPASQHLVARRRQWHVSMEHVTLQRWVWRRRKTLEWPRQRTIGTWIFGQSPGIWPMLCPKQEHLCNFCKNMGHASRLLQIMYTWCWICPCTAGRRQACKITYRYGDAAAALGPPSECFIAWSRQRI